MSPQSSEKGQDGEIQVALAICTLDRSTYHVVHNVTVEVEDGTTQIDHVIISRFGIFVVETKNYAGLIFGRERERSWTRMQYGRKYSFQNPLRQNYRHIKSLMEFLGLGEDRFHSVIAFCGESEFKTPVPPQVISSGYADYIKCKNDVLISDQAVLSLVDKLKSGMLPRGDETNRIHLESLQKRHGSNRKSAETQDRTSIDSNQRLRTKQRVSYAERIRSADTWNKPQVELSNAPPTVHEQVNERKHHGLFMVAGALFILFMAIMGVTDMVRQVSSIQARTPQVRVSPPTPAPMPTVAAPSQLPVGEMNTLPVAVKETRVNETGTEQNKEIAWERWYKSRKPCEWMNGQTMVECGNSYIKARREFDILYAKGQI